MSFKPPDLEMLWTALGSGTQVSIKNESAKAWLLAVMHPQNGLMETWLAKSQSAQNPSLQVGWSGLVGNILTQDKTVLVWLKAKLNYPRQQQPQQQFATQGQQQQGIQQFMGQPAQPQQPMAQQFVQQQPQQQFVAQPVQQQQPAPQQLPTDLNQLYDLKHSLSPDNPSQKTAFYRVIEEIKKIEGNALGLMHLQNLKSRKDLSDMLNVVGLIMNQLTIAMNDGTDKLGTIIGMNKFGKLQLRSQEQTQIVSQPQYHEQGPEGQMAPLSPQEIQARQQTAQVPQNKQQTF